jgi:hypothetical protein
MEAKRSSETSVCNKFTGRHIPVRPEGLGKLEKKKINSRYRYSNPRPSVASLSRDPPLRMAETLFSSGTSGFVSSFAELKD